MLSLYLVKHRAPFTCASFSLWGHGPLGRLNTDLDDDDVRDAYDVDSAHRFLQGHAGSSGLISKLGRESTKKNSVSGDVLDLEAAQVARMLKSKALGVISFGPGTHLLN